MIRDTTIVIKEGGVRLDAAILDAYPSTTRAFVKEAIASGNVLIGHPTRRVAKGLKLRGGETIIVHELLEAADNLVTPAGVCPRPIFEDDSLLAFA